jgi:hypothetical protein
VKLTAINQEFTAKNPLAVPASVSGSADAASNELRERWNNG